jgi:hypothetical protein
MMLRLFNNTKNIFLFLAEEFADGISLERSALKKSANEQPPGTEQTLATENAPVLEFD